MDTQDRSPSPTIAHALGLCLLLAGLGGPPCHAEDTLAFQLNRYAPTILAELRKRGHDSVGVLKFQVLQTGGQLKDNAGTLNLFLADRLQVALVLVRPKALAQQLKIVRDASQIAAELPGASHLGDAGHRRKLFDPKYPLAWGNTQIHVDAFLTGVAQFTADRNSFRIGIYCVTPDDSKLLIPPFHVAADSVILQEAGESYVARGGDSRPPAQLAQQVRQSPEQEHPLQRGNRVSLQVFYDDQPVQLEFRDGQAWIPEPKEGQRVKLRVERHDPGPGLLGAVVKINGENIFLKERRRDYECLKLVLRPDTRLTIDGFFEQLRGADNVSQFKVASREESEHLEMYYGADVGMISMTVYAESKDDSGSELQRHGLKPLDDDAPRVLAIEAGELPANAANDVDLLRSQLYNARTNYASRGVIVGGSRSQRDVLQEDHRWDPQPVISAVIRYYRPRASAAP
ncbi:MAG: hypothetical protein KDB14_07835 [Planctomycetales bacterium]|nr:hypothetical protein [Planctomycetales bacterium]